jgi:hypothetical protein
MADLTLLLSKQAKYNIGDPFPFFSIPDKLTNPTSGTFDDFQWWSYTSDFEKWLKANPRTMKTEESSDILSRYGSYEELVESISLQYRIQEESHDDLPVKTFENFTKEAKYGKLFEADPPAAGAGGASMETRARDQIKINYAYNKLKADGKLKAFDVTEITSDTSKCVFTCLRDDSGKAKMQSLTAFRMAGFGQDTDKAKVRLVDITEARPLGVLDKAPTMEKLVSSMALGISAVGGFMIGSVLFSGAMKTFEVVEGIRAIKALKGFLPGARGAVQAAETAKDASRLSKIANGSIKAVKGLFGMVPFKNTYLAGKVAARGISGAYKSAKYGGDLSTVAKAFTTGATRGSAAAAEAGFKAIPFVGEVLMLIQATGSIINWNSDNQAPSYNELRKEGFANNEFDPKNIAIGSVITICWSQPAGSTMGTVASFFYDNDTRTTATLLKVANTDAQSVFVLVDINVASTRKQLAQHSLILIGISNSEVYNTHKGVLNQIHRVLDAEDIDYEISYLDGIANSAALFDFEGMCEWNDFLTYFDAASDQYLTTDKDAPEKYLFYYKDEHGDHINVEGKLLDADKLKGLSNQDFDVIFNPTDANKKDFGFTDDRTKKNESLDIIDVLPMLVNESKESGSGLITSFADFQKGVARLSNIDEAGETPGTTDATKSSDDTKEDSDETIKHPDSSTSADSSTNDAADKAKQPEEDSPDETNNSSNSDVAPPNNRLKEGSNALLTGPKAIAVYSVVARQYADPDLRKYTPGVFTNFFINPADYRARQGQKISPETNTYNETVDNPRAGVYTFVKKDKKDNGENVDTTNPKIKHDGGGKGNDNGDGDGNDAETKDKKGDYYINVNPDDVSIKNRKNSTTITDNNFEGGINIEDKFLNDKEKEILDIRDWKTVTTAKLILDNAGNPTEVKLKNRNATVGSRVKKYRVTDGESFQVAVRFAKEIQDRLRYQ